MTELEKKRVTSLQADLTAVKLAEEMALQGGIFTERSLKQSVASNLLNHYSFPQATTLRSAFVLRKSSLPSCLKCYEKGSLIPARGSSRQHSTIFPRFRCDAATSALFTSSFFSLLQNHLPADCCGKMFSLIERNYTFVASSSSHSS